MSTRTTRPARVYKLAPEGLSAIEKRRLLLVAVVGLVMVLFAMYILREDLVSGNLLTAAPTIALTITCLVIFFWKSKARQRDAWLSYELLLGEKSIGRRVSNFPEMEIAREEVTAIRELSSGLRVETKFRDRFIFIHQNLIGFDEVKSELQQWKALSPAGQNRTWLYVCFLIGCLALMAVFFTSRTRWVVITTGLPLVAILVYSLFAGLRRRFLPRKTKLLLLVSILPLLAIIVGLVRALAGMPLQ